MHRIFGYQDLALMNQHIISGLAISPELAQLSERMPHFIEYQFNNMVKWTGLDNIIERRAEPKSAHENPGNLENYVRGLVERNEYAWSDHALAEALLFAKGKRVLDFGCGGGFYARAMCKTASEVYAYDRDPVIQIMNQWYKKPGNLVSLSDLPAGISEFFDAIWISEVLHGKNPSECAILLQDLKKMLKKDGILCINELQPGVPEAAHFEYNMLINGRSGKVYSVFEMVEILRPLGFRPKIVSCYKYHYTMEVSLDTN